MSYTPHPLISCIMPTAGRAAYVEQSIDMFLRQDYVRKELIIVYNRDSDLPKIYFPKSVRLVRAGTKIIGAKRNEACAYARGAIIAQWDDDDIYNTQRLSIQAAPILRGAADITGLQNFVFYEAPTGQSWLATPQLFARVFVANVHGGSLVYNRAWWAGAHMYPNISIGEDAEFLRRNIKRGARLLPVDGYGAFVYVRHNSNTWKFEKDNFRRYRGWERAALPEWAQAREWFYRHMAGRPVAAVAGQDEVSAMPRSAPKLPGITSTADSACVVLM